MTVNNDNDYIQSLIDTVIANGGNMQSKEFNEAMSLAFPKIETFLSKLIYNQSDLDDLVAVSIESIIRGFHTYTNEYKFMTWAYSVTKNINSKYRRSRLLNKRLVYESQMLKFNTYDTDCDGDLNLYDEWRSMTYLDVNPDDIEVSKDKVSNLGDIYSVLMRFDDCIDKDMFIHKEINNIQLKDIADFYKMSIGTVKTKVYKFRKKLNDIIKSEYEGLTDVLFV